MAADTAGVEAIDISRQAERSLELMMARKPTKNPREVGGLRLNGKKQSAVQPTLHQLSLRSGFLIQKRLSCKNSKHMMSLNGKY